MTTAGDLPKESSAPDTVKPSHIGRTILYRMPYQVVVSEGQISALSPEGKYFRVGNKRWLPNRPGTVVALLETVKHRSTPFTK